MAKDQKAAADAKAKEEKMRADLKAKDEKAKYDEDTKRFILESEKEAKEISDRAAH